MQFCIEQQEEKSQLESTSSRLGWIFFIDGNCQSSSEVKDRHLAIYSVFWPEAPRKEMEYSANGIIYDPAWGCPLFQHRALDELFSGQRSNP